MVFVRARGCMGARALLELRLKASCECANLWRIGPASTDPFSREGEGVLVLLNQDTPENSLSRGLLPLTLLTR